MLRAERGGLLLQGGSQGALSQAEGRGVGDLLQGVEIHVQARPLVPEGAAGNDFTPAGGQVTDFLAEFGRKFTPRRVGTTLYLQQKCESNSSALYTTHDSALQSC